jgi:hypothetical protein
MTALALLEFASSPVDPPAKEFLQVPAAHLGPVLPAACTVQRAPSSARCEQGLNPRPPVYASTRRNFQEHHQSGNLVLYLAPNRV